MKKMLFTLTMVFVFGSAATVLAQEPVKVETETEEVTIEVVDEETPSSEIPASEEPATEE